jgi:bla regulator protein BlaR1
MILANVRFNRGLRRCFAQPVDPQLIEQLEAYKQTLHIRRCVKLIVTDYVSSPALTGIFRPKLLLPAALLPALGAKQLQHIMLHELSHLKRLDLLANAIMQALLAIHWFNPLLWCAYARMREDQELACDALALSRLEPSDRRYYALTIIQLLESWSAYRPFVHAAGMSGSRPLLRRIMMIHSNKPAGLRRTILGLAALLLIAGCSLTGSMADKPDAAQADRMTNTTFVDAMKAESLEAAHATSSNVLSNQGIIAKYNGSQQLLASQDGIIVYGDVKVEDTKRSGLIYSYDSLTIEMDGKSHTYPWTVISDRSIHPRVRLLQEDVNQDGKHELIVITSTSTWQEEGARRQESLHIINPEDWSETVLPDPVEAVKNAISSTVTRNDQMTTFSFEFEGKRYTQEEQYYPLNDGIPTQVVDHLVFGNTVIYSIVNGVIQADVSASIDEDSGASLSGFLSVIATYGPELGKPTIAITTNMSNEEVRETT